MLSLFLVEGDAGGGVAGPRRLGRVLFRHPHNLGFIAGRNAAGGWKFSVVTTGLGGVVERVAVGNAVTADCDCDCGVGR